MHKGSFPKAGKIVILFFLITIPFVNISHHRWLGDEGVIIWDIKQYYAYLPAAIIYDDLSLQFIDDNHEFFGKWFWPVETPTGKRAIVTTMGLSYMYSPFFLLSHLYAKVSPKYEADGFSVTYHVGLTFSALFYFIIGLVFLRKALRHFFPEGVTALTLFLVGAGTNLLYYTTYEAPMSHAYNFALISVFFYLVIKWWRNKSLLNTVFLGIIGGVIVLIRPTNIIVLLMIPLYGIKSFKDLGNNFAQIFKDWQKLLVMILAFTAVWIPQFLYWKYISGKFFYFSYGEVGGKFFFDNPQIYRFLFSYAKGWLVYTPIMLFAIAGFIFLYKKNRTVFWPVIVPFVLSVYILSSWWSWWFGGAFGQRSMVDFYGLLSFPLAAFIHYFFTRKKVVGYIVSGFLIVLAAFSIFQVQQYNRGAIHYWWMNKEAYWETFLQLRPTTKYWHVITIPDYDKAREGVYTTLPAFNRSTAVTDDELKNEIINELSQPYTDSLELQNCETAIDSALQNYATRMIQQGEAEKYFDRLKIEKYKAVIVSSARWNEQVKEKAQKMNVDYKHMLNLEAQRVYNLYGQKYDQ